MATDAPPPEPATPWWRRRFVLPVGLSARLLLLTVLFVAIANLFIIPPALAAFEEQWLLDRVRAAELASFVEEVVPEGPSARMSQQLLSGAGVVRVAIQTEGMRRLVMQQDNLRFTETPYHVDLRQARDVWWLTAPLQTFFGAGGYVRVTAEARFRAADFVEVVVPDARLKTELITYLWNLIAVAIFTSAVAGLLVYVSLNLFLVRPMQRITRSMERFRANPEDAEAALPLSGRQDEIGRAEEELGRMQADLRVALTSQRRLAALGEAVAKINHDLRNMLTSAQLASESLAAIDDPKISRALPRLERALDRAITLASNTLAYGKTEEPAPDARPVVLTQALETAAEDARLTPDGVALDSGVPQRAQVLADPEQLQRMLVNILRNAREAIVEAPGRNGKGKVTVGLTQADGVSLIRIEDDGPGLPDKARAGLFQPFMGSTRRGGTGLGLAIARELAQNHGGDVVLVESSAAGSVFEIRLPGAPPPAPAKRVAKAEKPQ
ncbi:MAG: HAMP domain-containing sensor histidine kinase [Caulobacteraceae bacterium]